MRNIKLTIEYDGSRYQGWVRLGKNESTNTISNKILEVIRKMTGEDVELFCGARTEVGVHAYGQTASFKTNTDMKDYEDAVLAVCAKRTGADYIATRDEGFINEPATPVTALHPQDVLGVIRDEDD